jgi:hypothetical protein
VALCAALAVAWRAPGGHGAAAAPPLALAQGLVGYWHFDDGAGGAAVRDHSGNEHHCQLRNQDPDGFGVDGPVGTALRLGPRARLECPLPPVSARAPVGMTTAAWINNWTLRKYHGALASRQLAGWDQYFLFAIVDESLVIRSAAWGVALAHPIDALDRWVHVAFTHEPGGRTRLFADGLAVAEAWGSGPSSQVDDQSVARPMIVGATITSDDGKKFNQRFHGAMDELLVYDRALGDAEIAALARGAQPAR